MTELRKGHSSNSLMLVKYNSQHWTDENIEELIEKEQRINNELIKKNNEIKEKNWKLQKQLLNYIYANDITENDKEEKNFYEASKKYKIILITVNEYLSKYQSVNQEMKNEIFSLLRCFFNFLRSIILKQRELCCLMQEDMNEFRVQKKVNVFHNNFLQLRKLYEHNSILRAQIDNFNKFKLKDENLIHADFEQLERKYKNIKAKENKMKSKIRNLNEKVVKTTEKKLHYDEKNMYIENLLSERSVHLEESNAEIKKKKKLLNDLKKQTEEVAKKCADSEATVLARNVFETYDKKKLYLQHLQQQLQQLKEEYENSTRQDSE